jgi:pyroglutamyl-peptidase
MHPAILLTGFEPFGNHLINSSWEASYLVGQQFPNIITARLPVDYLAAREELGRLLSQHKPTICLCSGLTSAPAFAIERVARKPEQFSHIPGPDLLEGAWPWPEAESQCQQAQHPFSTSYDAGQYVCESTYWALLDFRRQFGYPNYAAFIHVPPLSDDISAEMIAGVLSNILQARLAAAGVNPT